MAVRTATVRLNKYAGSCTECGQRVPEQEGRIFRDGEGKWRVRHHPVEMVHPTGPWDRFESYQRRGTGCPQTV